MSSELRGLALSAHICPRLVQSILERVDRRCVDDILWQVVPVCDGPVTEEIDGTMRLYVLVTRSMEVGTGSSWQQNGRSNDLLHAATFKFNVQYVHVRRFVKKLK